MAKCSSCGRSGVFVRTGRGGLCRGCRTNLSQGIEAEKERIRESLVWEGCLESPRDRVLHLRRALAGARALARYERLGFRDIRPDPVALAALLEKKLALAEESARASGHPVPKDLVLASAEGSSGETRKARRHSVKIRVRIDPGGVRALAEDLSSRGIRLQCRFAGRVGQRVQITVYAPSGPAVGDGRVRWSRPVGPAGGSATRNRMGIQWDAFPPQLAPILREESDFPSE